MHNSTDDQANLKSSALAADPATSKKLDKKRGKKKAGSKAAAEALDDKDTRAANPKAEAKKFKSELRLKENGFERQQIEATGDHQSMANGIHGMHHHMQHHNGLMPQLPNMPGQHPGQYQQIQQQMSKQGIQNIIIGNPIEPIIL